MPVLPPEIIDMILDRLPIYRDHEPPGAQSLLPLRLVSHAFTVRLTPALFHHVRLRAVDLRATSTPLRHLADTPHLAARARVLSIDGPADGLDDLAPYLSRFVNVHTLHLTMTHPTSRVLPPAFAPVVHPFATMMRDSLVVLQAQLRQLVETVREAQLAQLEIMLLGLPYDGGYAGFFQDIEWAGAAFRDVAKGLRRGSVKLADRQRNYTIMPVL